MSEDKIITTYDLEKLLIKKLGDDLDLEPFALLMGMIEGKYKNQHFNILFEYGQSLILSTETKDVISAIIPILNYVMGEDPICSYDRKENDFFLLTSVEWNIENPKKRIYELQTSEETLPITNMTIYYDLESKQKIKSIENKKVGL